MRLNKRRGQVAIEYALLSAFVAVAIVASIFYLETNTRKFYSDWGGQESQKVTTKALIDHYNGNPTGTEVGAPVKPIGSSGLMSSLSTYTGPVSIVGSNGKPNKPTVVKDDPPGKDKEQLKDTLLSKIEEKKKEDPGAVLKSKEKSDDQELGDELKKAPSKELDSKPSENESKDVKKEETVTVSKAEAKPKSESNTESKGSSNTDMKVDSSKQK